MAIISIYLLEDFHALILPISDKGAVLGYVVKEKHKLLTEIRAVELDISD